jgi:4-aminobutyrate aminotransferase-like enzyme
VFFFVCSGSEANDLALRLARTHTRRRDTIVIEGAYHGNLTSLIEISPYKFDGPGGEGAPPHVKKVPLPDVYRGPYKSGDPEAGVKYARHVERAIEEIKKEGRLPSAFICESFMSSAGVIEFPPGYLQNAFRHARSSGAICIADEVQVGFGRLGTHFWGFETQGVVPDIVTTGKPIGNGHPLAAVVTTPEVAASFKTGMEYFNTFGGNPVSCAVGLAVLDVLEKENLQTNAFEVGRFLRSGLEELKERHPLIGDIRGSGLFFGVELVLNRLTLEPAAAEAAYIVERMKDKGILISTEGPFHNVLKIRPPMVFEKADAVRLINVLNEVLTETALQP